MTVLDNFVAFARALPSARRDEVEEALASLMDNYDGRYDFTDHEAAELHRRASDPAPAYTEAQDIAAIFGKPFAD